MREAVIVTSLRTAIGKAPRGTLRHTRPDDMAAVVLSEVLRRTPGLQAEEIEDVILGCAIPEGEQGHNMGRIATLRAGLPPTVSAMTINRFCSSGLQSIAMAAECILAGFADVIIAGGAESMSMVPMTGHKLAPNPYLADCYPDVYLNMGLTAENLARKHNIMREDADAFALASHQKAAAAIRDGKFKDEIVPLEVTTTVVSGGPAGNGAKAESKIRTFAVDECPRLNASLEALAKLRPVFHVRGTVTAGNSSQMSDGAAAAVVMPSGTAILSCTAARARSGASVRAPPA